MVAANVTNTYVVPAGSKVAPYYDDFDEAKNFHRVLFRPGYAVQARELTQLQTILQNQVERFGRHIFTDGSPVIGGDVYIPEDSFTGINLTPQYGSSNTAIKASDFNKKTIVLGPTEDSTVKFRVMTTTEATDTDPPTIYGVYVSSDVFSESKTIKVEGEEIYANIAAVAPISINKLAFLRDSIFFYSGYFVKVPSQTAVIGKYNSVPSCRVGLEMNDEITTENEDTTLLDPALGASNYQAPGASRYKIDLTLTSRSLDSVDDSKFIELAKVEDGGLKSLVKFPVYSEIEEVLARRTYDESGNYTVRPFVARFDQDYRDPDNYISAIMSPGKAYIYGYEYETISESRVQIPKARTTVSELNYEYNLNFGNYVIVDGLSGKFDPTTADLFDIHCVPIANVDFTSNTTYQKTKIGTGHINSLEFYGGDVDVTTRKYEFYFFDTNYRSITSNTLTSTSNTVTFFNGSNLLTTTNNAYSGATLRIVSGTGKGQVKTVDSYNGVTNTITLTTDFTDSLDTTSNVSLEFDFAETDSFVKHKLYTPGATSNANCNITTLNKTDGVSTGATFVFEPSLASLVFKMPADYLSTGIANTSYNYKKKFSSLAFTSGVSANISSGPNEYFLGSTVTSNIASSVMENFFVVCTDKGSSGRSNGDIIKATVTVGAGSNTAYFSTGNTSAGDTFVADVFAAMEFETGVAPKQKTFVQANSVSLSNETSVNLTGWNTGSYANVYANAAQVVINSPSRKVGVPETLYLSDVIGIKKIYDLNGQSLPSGGSSLTGYIDVTEKYTFDNGQKDTHYDHASISLKADYAPCVGPLIVCCYYYTHTSISNEGDYFSIDSYPLIGSVVNSDNEQLAYDGYALIPSYKRTNGEVVQLRDCIDFRPVRLNSANGNPNYTVTGYGNPIPTTNFLMDYSYYLGRRDLITITPERKFNLIQGVPSLSPKEPTIPKRAMVLYSIGIPPYTMSPNDVKVKFIDNRRYTMRDIGKIDKRVENLEYYVSLNLLEKKAVDMNIPDVNGLSRPKYGIFADSFTGHALGNSELIDYKCAMDLNEGFMQCQAKTTGVYLKANTETSSGITIHSDRLTLNYLETVLDQQPAATKTAPAAELLYAVFDGNIITLPEADIWKSTNVDPEIVVTDSDTVEYTRINVYQSIVNSQSRTS